MHASFCGGGGGGCLKNRRVGVGLCVGGVSRAWGCVRGAGSGGKAQRGPQCATALRLAPTCFTQKPCPHGPGA